MKYVWTFFWTFLLIQMLTYVSSSMIGVGYDFKEGSILAVGATILIYILPFIIPEDSSASGHASH
ncbi:YjzD family protein [Bacillus massilinigeriensis]|uniref:YjzD family protein n=1 Tax=Bacillus mediterraneensis TaxID=1805474 RepID=UPI0008F8EC54|nr:YjzD family protein [Bacillus mediterraneensis]